MFRLYSCYHRSNLTSEIYVVTPTVFMFNCSHTERIPHHYAYYLETSEHWTLAAIDLSYCLFVFYKGKFNV